jgi:hypothetical protein
MPLTAAILTLDSANSPLDYGQHADFFLFTSCQTPSQNTKKRGLGATPPVPYFPWLDDPVWFPRTLAAFLG